MADLKQPTLSAFYHKPGGSKPGRINEDLCSSANRLIFGHERFNPYQEEVIRAVLGDSDCFVLLPTGGGVSATSLHFECHAPCELACCECYALCACRSRCATSCRLC